MKPLLLFVSLEQWDDIWRRNQFFAVRLQKDFAVTFIGPQLPFWKAFVPKRTHYQGIKLRYVYKIFPERFFSRLNQQLYSWQYPRRTDVLWINDHTKYFLLEKIKYRQSMYDITDDWTLLDKKAIGPDRFLCQAVDQVIVCSQGLLHSRRKITKNITLIKNGLTRQDYRFFKTGKKYFLYTGSLHEDRLDVALMIRLAKKFPQEKFVYVGPIFMRAKTVARLSRLKNICLAGAQPYAKMAEYMSQAKALIVPHVQSSFVNSLDPIKQYEYMLSDAPVIATNVSGFNEWPRLFTVVDKTRFVAAIEQAIRGKIVVDVRARKAAAGQCTWDMRYKQIRGLLCANRS